MSFYIPKFYDYYYRPSIFKLDDKYPWCKETIIINAQFNRVTSNSSVILTLNGAQYDNFIHMTGTFTCVDANGETHMFTFQPDDVMTIIQNDYDEVHKAWLDNREAYRQQLIAEDREKCKKALEERRKRAEVEEAERMRHFWCRLFHRKK